MSEDIRKLTIEVLEGRNFKLGEILSNDSISWIISIELQSSEEKTILNFQTNICKGPQPKWNFAISQDVTSALELITFHLKKLESGIETKISKVCIPIELFINGELYEKWIDFSEDYSEPSPTMFNGEVLIHFQLLESFLGPIGNEIRESSLTIPKVQITKKYSGSNYMIDVLSKYKIKSTGFLPEDISITVVDSFKVLLQQNFLMDSTASEIDHFIESSSKLDTPRLIKKFLAKKFATDLEESLMWKMLESIEPNTLVMNELIQELVVFILKAWGIKDKVARRYANAAFYRKYESGFFKGASLSGWGKKLLPLWSKVSFTNIVVIYCLMKDTYLQYINNYFTHREIFLSSLPNPDFYARLGSACYDTLLMKITSITKEEQFNLLKFISEWFFSDSPIEPEKKNKLAKTFLKQFRKEEQSFNSSRYISGFNYSVNQEQSKRGSYIKEESNVHVSQSDEALKAIVTRKRGKSLTLRKNLKIEAESTLFIVEPSSEFCVSIFNQFYQVPNVKILNGSFSELEESYDCLIVPGNSLGIVDPSDNLLSELISFFGEKILQGIRSHIITNYMGELPTGSCILLSVHHPSVRYIAYCSMYISSQPTSIYSSFWSALCAIHRHNSQTIKWNATVTHQHTKENPIKIIVCKGFRSLAGNDIASREMFAAWEQYIQFARTSVPPLQIWNDIAKRDALIFAKSEDPEEKKRKFELDLISGKIESRGFIDHEGIRMLLDYVLDKNTSTEKKLAAASALAFYSFPEELIPGIRDIILERKGAITALLDLAVEGTIKFHHEIDIKDVIKETEVAHGAAGRVFKGSYQGFQAAIKLSGENYLGYDLFEFRREISITSMLRHKNLLVCYGAVTKLKEETLIITEWIGNGDLRKLLTSSDIELTWPLKFSLVIGIAKGMKFLHSLSLVHGDLKSQNIMLTEDYIAKIIDFGSCAIDGTISETSVGTTQWMAPECFDLPLRIHQQLDSYSFGIILWEVLTKELPYNDLPIHKIPQVVKKGERPPIPKQCSKDFASLINNCWSQNPKDRFTFQEIAKNLIEQAESYHLYLE